MMLFCSFFLLSEVTSSFQSSAFSLFSGAYQIWSYSVIWYQSVCLFPLYYGQRGGELYFWSRYRRNCSFSVSFYRTLKNFLSSFALHLNASQEIENYEGFIFFLVAIMDWLTPSTELKYTFQLGWDEKVTGLDPNDHAKRSKRWPICLLFFANVLIGQLATAARSRRE